MDLVRIPSCGSKYNGKTYRRYSSNGDEPENDILEVVHYDVNNLLIICQTDIEDCISKLASRVCPNSGKYIVWIEFKAVLNSSQDWSSVINYLESNCVHKKITKYSLRQRPQYEIEYLLPVLREIHYNNKHIVNNQIYDSCYLLYFIDKEKLANPLISNFSLLGKYKYIKSTPGYKELPFYVRINAYPKEGYIAANNILLGNEKESSFKGVIKHINLIFHNECQISHLLVMGKPYTSYNIKVSGHYINYTTDKNSAYVKKIKVLYKLRNLWISAGIFQANSNRLTQVCIELPNIKTKHIRVIPLEWEGNPVININAIGLIKNNTNLENQTQTNKTNKTQEKYVKYTLIKAVNPTSEKRKQNNPNLEKNTQITYKNTKYTSCKKIKRRVNSRLKNIINIDSTSTKSKQRSDSTKLTKMYKTVKSDWFVSLDNCEALDFTDL